MKYDCKVVYACNPDVPQKSLSELSQSHVIGEDLNKVVVNQYKEAG